MRFWRSSTQAAAIAMLWHSGAMAQTEPVQAAPETAAAADEEVDNGDLNMIVVVAQKREERLGDVPVSVGVVQGQDLDRLNLSSMDQMARYVPTFNVAESASGNRITLRGISSGTNRGFEQSVGLFVDGIYAGRAAQFTSPFFDVERIEVLKGPQSILFGKNTVAGAVSIITAKPKDVAEGVFTGGYETRFGGFNLSGVVNQPLTDNLQVRLAYRHEERDDGVMHNTLKDADEPGKNADLARVSLAWQPGDFTVNAKYEYSESSRKGGLFQMIDAGPYGGLYTSYDPEFETGLNLTTSNGFAGSDVNTIKAHNAALRVELPVGTGTLTSDSGYSSFTARVRNEDADFTNVPLIAYNNHENFSQYSQELRYASPADDRIAYTLGLFLQTQHYINRPGYVITATALGLYDTDSQRTFDQRTNTYSGFAELSFEVVDGLRIIGGGRYILEDKKVHRYQSILDPVTGLLETDASILARNRAIFQSANYDLQQRLKETQFTPAVTVQYKPYDGLMAYAKFSRGFKSGGFDASDGLGTAAPYDSESVSAWEAGVKWSATRTFNLNLTGFYSRFNDLQTQQFNGIGFITTNAAKSSARGVEAEARWRPVRPLTLAASMSYLDAHYNNYPGANCTTDQAAAWTAGGNVGRCTQDLSGRPLTDSPKWSSSVNASYDVDVMNDWRLRADVGANYRSSAYVSTDLDHRSRQGAYATFDATLELTAPSDRITVAVLAKNISDKRAMTYLVNNPFFTGAKSVSIIEPRTLELRATYRY